MTEDDYDAFVNALAGVMEMRRQRLTDVAIGSWWVALKDQDIDAVVDAFERFMQSGDETYGFTSNHIIKLIEGSSVDTAHDAWTKVDYAVRNAGPWADVVFEDPIIHRVIEDMGGWAGFGQKTDKEFPFVAKEFETRYRSYKIRANLDTYLPRLTGIANTHNSTAGFARQDPVLIGDLAKVSAVMNGSAGKPKIGFTRAGAELMALLPQLAKKPLAIANTIQPLELPFIQGKLA